MLTVNAYAAPSATEPLVPITIERRDLGPNDVLIDIAYAGICHSDIHTVRGDWGPSPTRRSSGTRSSVSSARSAPRSPSTRSATVSASAASPTRAAHCEQCLKGQEVYCLNGNLQTYAGVDVDGTITQGGYSQAIVVNEDFVLKVPESLALEKVAPLLCAGITLYSPLKHWNAGPGSKVAIVGMGGLGHVGVKLAHALGAEVTVLSRTLSKKEDGLTSRRGPLLRHRGSRHLREARRASSTSSSTPSPRGWTSPST